MININRLLGVDEPLREDLWFRYQSNPILRLERDLVDEVVLGLYKEVYGRSGEEARWIMMANYMIMEIVEKSSGVDGGPFSSSIPRAILERREVFVDDYDKKHNGHVRSLQRLDLNVLYEQYSSAVAFGWVGFR